jgi:enoyl-CoA hydratase
MAIRFVVEGGVGLLTLDRPERAHAYDAAHLEAIAGVLRSLTVSVLVVASTGDRAFCAGADLGEMAAAGPLDALDLRSQAVFTALARVPAVTIAAVQGAAVAGGFELALACDLRVAGPAARFVLPETGLGIVPSAGGTTRLARLVGISRAKEVILAGREVDAATALAWGLVHRVAEDPRDEAVRWATALLGRDVTAMIAAKRLLDADEPAASLLGERVVEAGLYARKRNS